jgi:hypothetical protein
LSVPVWVAELARETISQEDARCKCGHPESEHRVGKTADFGGYCCAYVGVGGAGFGAWCQCPGFERVERAS